MNDLRYALLDIATSAIHGLKTPPGPNNWDSVREDILAHGDCFDYEILDLGEHQVIYPVCEAALQWLYRHLPADCPRWGAKGFKIEAVYAKPILDRMFDDGLISENEYVEAMNNEERDRHAGENQ